MGKNPPKEIGNSGKCFRCNKPIYCKEGYQGKPTWKNNDGSSHYNKEGECADSGNFETTGKSSPQVTETKVIWEKLDEQSDDQRQLVLGLTELRALAYDFTKGYHPELPDNTNLFGQIVNANMTHLLSLMQIKAIKEKS